MKLVFLKKKFQSPTDTFCIKCYFSQRVLLWGKFSFTIFKNFGPSLLRRPRDHVPRKCNVIRILFSLYKIKNVFFIYQSFEKKRESWIKELPFLYLGFEIFFYSLHKYQHNTPSNTVSVVWFFFFHLVRNDPKVSLNCASTKWRESIYFSNVRDSQVVLICDIRSYNLWNFHSTRI